MTHLKARFEMVLVELSRGMLPISRALQVEHDRHVEDLFGRADWLRLLSEVGFRPHVVPLEHSELEPGSHEVFVANRPSGQM